MIQKKVEPVFEATATVEPEPEPEQEKEKKTPKPQTGETEPPDDELSELSPVVKRLDEVIAEYCKGDTAKMRKLWKKLTVFDGKNGPKFCNSAAECMKSKNPDGWAGRAKREFEQKVLVNFNFRLDEED